MLRNCGTQRVEPQRKTERRSIPLLGFMKKNIRNCLTAENAVNRLAIQTKNKARIERAEADYQKIVAKYTEAEPMTGRLDREINAKKKLRQKTYSVTMILFRKAEPKEEKDKEVKDISINVDAETKAEREILLKNK